MRQMFFRGTISAVAGTKMSTDYPWSVAPYPRRIKSIYLTGGSAAGDTKFYLKAGQVLIATLYNMNTDDVCLASYAFKCGLYVPANVPLFGQVGETAAGSGSIFRVIELLAALKHPV